MTTLPKKTIPTPAATTASKQQGRRDFLKFGLVAGGALVVAGYFLWPTQRQGLLAMPADAVPVAISMSGFSPNALTEKVGQEISIQLINKDNSVHSDGGGWHQFRIEELDVDFKVGPLEESLSKFVVDWPGTYDFYCGVCCGGKANPYMHGNLVVEA